MTVKEVMEQLMDGKVKILEIGLEKREFVRWRESETEEDMLT